MQEAIKITIGIIVLVLGFPIGSLLARYTKEELAAGRRWFNLLVILSLIGAIIGLVMGNDFLLFTFAFIAIVTSRSMKRKRPEKKGGKR